MTSNDSTENAADSAGRSADRKDRAPRGERLRQMLDFLNHERVDRDLIFTAEHAAQLKQQIGLSSAHSYATLMRLEERGLITRKVLPKGRGILVTVLGRTGTPKASGNGKKDEPRSHRSIREIRAKAQAEIAHLEKALEEKKAFLAQLNGYMQEV